MLGPELFQVFEYVTAGLLTILAGILKWYFGRIEKKLNEIDCRFGTANTERRHEIRESAKIIERLMTDLKDDIKRQLDSLAKDVDELARDVKMDTGEMAKVKQRLVAIEVKLGILPNYNGD